MIEYIEREAAIHIAEMYGLTNGTSLGRHSGVADIIADGVAALPAADVEPVRYGEWISDDYGYNHCSECGFEHDEPEYVTPHCPGCGANMDGSEAGQDETDPV